MDQPVWVFDDIVYSVHLMLLAEHGGQSGVRDIALLESALNRPKQRFEYEADSTIFDLAASYSFGLAKNHPFVDGNKRIALAVGAIFLELNSVILNATEAGTVIVFEQLASSDFTEQQLSQWYSTNSFSA